MNRRAGAAGSTAAARKVLPPGFRPPRKNQVSERQPGDARRAVECAPAGVPAAQKNQVSER